MKPTIWSENEPFHDIRQLSPDNLEECYTIHTFQLPPRSLQLPLLRRNCFAAACTTKKTTTLISPKNKFSFVNITGNKTSTLLSQLVGRGGLRKPRNKFIIARSFLEPVIRSLELVSTRDVSKIVSLVCCILW